MDFLKLIGTIGMLSFVVWLIHQDGKQSGRNEMLIQAQAQSIKERDEANADLREQLDAGKESAAQAVVDMATVQASIKTIEQRTGSIGAQLRGALSASSLGTCVLPDDVRRLRADAYQQAGDAVTSANQARDPH